MAPNGRPRGRRTVPTPARPGRPRCCLRPPHHRRSRGSRPRSPLGAAELDALRAAVGGVGLPDELSDVPFGHLLAPMVKDTQWLRLEDRLEPAVLAPISDQARASLRRDLAERLIEVCGRAWYAEFTSDRPQGTTVQLRLGAPPSGRDDRYRQWCQRQSDDQLADVLGRYPVLGRLMATVSQQWAISTAAMIDRLADHRAQLASQLAVPVDAAVEQITTGLSDRHRSGQTVAILRFATPTGPISVVYKPKDLAHGSGSCSGCVQPSTFTSVTRHSIGSVW